MSAWESVACCDECWFGTEDSFWPNGRGVLEQGIRQPKRFVQEMRVEEYCHFCGWTTYSGIYVRVNTNDQPAAPLRVRKERT
jgi:hypothetical protein